MIPISSVLWRPNVTTRLVVFLLVKESLVRYGFPAYWREKGWPVGCRALGETDFECGGDSAPTR